MRLVSSLFILIFTFNARSDAALADKKSFRENALTRARVWIKPQIPIENANLAETEKLTNGFEYRDNVICEWDVEEKTSGATSKFYCRIAEKNSVKVKYSERENSNPEIYAEVMASRLLRALGFGADRMYLVSRVRCFGCPSDPWTLLFQMHSPFEQVRKDFYRRYGTRSSNGEIVFVPNYNKFEEFENVAIERKFGGKKIESFDNQGWSFKETSQIGSGLGGSARAEVDALRLLSSFIQHADNKRDNQSLVCLDKTPSSVCQAPFAFIKDLGSSFGSGFHGSSHHKADVSEWAKTPIWLEGCRVEIKSSMTGGFDDTPISEEGRAFLAGLLDRLSDTQIRQLFEGGRVSDIKYGSAANRDVDTWIKVFKTKRTEISKKRCR